MRVGRFRLTLAQSARIAEASPEEIVNPYGQRGDESQSEAGGNWMLYILISEDDFGTAAAGEDHES